MPKHDETDLTPLYAVAGLADIIAETFRETVAARQRKAEERLAEIRDRRLERVEQARVNADELREFLSTLPEQFRSLPETTRVRLAELQRQTEELLAQAGDTYSSLAGRGKRVVDVKVGDVRATGRKARAAAEDGLDDAAGAVQPLVDQAQEAVTEVRRNVTGRAAKVRKPTEPADDVTPESATSAARAAAAAASTTTASTTASESSAEGDVSPAQALAQEREAEAKAKAEDLGTEG
jgi:ABC-type transporter Mla subunit MlaD